MMTMSTLALALLVRLRWFLNRAEYWSLKALPGQGDFFSSLGNNPFLKSYLGVFPNQRRFPFLINSFGL